jgi:hypothetical protein
VGKTRKHEGFMYVLKVHIMGDGVVWIIFMGWMDKCQEFLMFCGNVLNNGSI